MIELLHDAYAYLSVHVTLRNLLLVIVVWIIGKMCEFTFNYFAFAFPPEKLEEMKKTSPFRAAIIVSIRGATADGNQVSKGLSLFAKAWRRKGSGIDDEVEIEGHDEADK